MSLSVTWMKCTEGKPGVWCRLNSVNLEHEHFDGLAGVYIIWHGGPHPATVCIGQGDIRERLRAHRSDRLIQAYSALGLHVTWATVSVEMRNGVERFLAESLSPKVGSRFPEAAPIQVALPW